MDTDRWFHWEDGWWWGYLVPIIGFCDGWTRAENRQPVFQHGIVVIWNLKAKLLPLEQSLYCLTVVKEQFMSTGLGQQRIFLERLSANMLLGNVN